VTSAGRYVLVDKLVDLRRFNQIGYLKFWSKSALVVVVPINVMDILTEWHPLDSGKSKYFASTHLWLWYSGSLVGYSGTYCSSFPGSYCTSFPGSSSARASVSCYASFPSRHFTCQPD